MKNILFLMMGILTISICFSQQPDGITGATTKHESNGNSYYHKTPETSMQISELWVGGEVENSGQVDLNDFYKREVFYKEALPNDSGTVNFVGAYRFSGYSLFDLLDGFILDKMNKAEFRPAMDVYVVIENDLGETVTFSWAEIFYTHLPHQIIIATESAPIEPHKIEVDYPVTEKWTVIAANDLFSYRVLENPVKITVKSFDKKNYPIDRSLRNSISPKVKLVLDNQLLMTIDTNYKAPQTESYSSLFYGMGMGYHPIPVFEGMTLYPLIASEVQTDVKRWMKDGLVCFVGNDGYRVIYSYAELFNRVDQVKPILSKITNNPDNGYFRVYHPDSFYADMSAKNLMEIYFFTEVR